MRELYTAIVRQIDGQPSSDDPIARLKRGFIRVSCAELLGDHDTVCPVWIRPSLEWGWFVVPDIGEMISIGIETTSESDEIRGQITIDAPDLDWTGVRYYSENKIGDTPTIINGAFTESNYGKRRGFCTPYGHTILFDDTKGDSQVYITSVVGKHNTSSGEIVSEDKINQIVLDKNGIRMSMLDAYTLQMSPEGTLDLSLDGDNTLTINGAGGATTAQIGDGEVAVAVADHLQTLYLTALTGIKAAFDGHFHPTSMGPSGTAVNAQGAAVFPAWEPKINSDKLTIPDTD